MTELKDIEKVSVDELELPTRCVNCLALANVKTIGDLVKKSSKDLLSIRSFGTKSLRDIREALKDIRITYHLGDLALDSD